MSQPVNLNRARKAKAKAAKKARGDENAARFGQSKAEKELRRAQEEKARRDLDGHEQDR